MLAIPVGYRRAFVFRPGLQKFYISQPSLTNSIHELEQELGLTIFHRTNRGVVLTPEGLVTVQKRHKDLNNQVIAGAPAGMVINTHVCRGNFHSTYANSGAYDPVADILFGEENVNAYYRDRQQADRGRAVGKTPAGQGDRRDRLGRFSAQPISVSTFGAGSAILKLNKTYKNRRFSL